MLFNYLYSIIYGVEENINDKDLIELIPSLTPLSMCELPENRVRL